jgi:hypothetical protein
MTLGYLLLIGDIVRNAFGSTLHMRWPSSFLRDWRDAAIVILIGSVMSPLLAGEARAERWCLSAIEFAQPVFVVNPGHDEPEPGQAVPPRLEPIEGMELEISLAQPGWLNVQGHVGFQQEDGTPACSKRNYVLRYMTGVDVVLNGRRVAGTLSTANWDRAEHYHDMTFAATVDVDAGSHIVAVRGVQIAKNGGRNSCKVYYKARQYSGVTVQVFQPC